MSVHRTHHKCYLCIVHQKVKEVNDERSLKRKETDIRDQSIKHIYRNTSDVMSLPLRFKTNKWQVCNLLSVLR